MHLSLYALIGVCSFLVISCEVCFEILIQGKETVPDVGSFVI